MIKSGNTLRQNRYGGEFGKQANNGADEVRKEVYKKKKIRQLEFKVVNSVKLMNIKLKRCDPFNLPVDKAHFLTKIMIV